MAVFISYRREEALGVASQLADVFRDRLGYDLVFHDMSSIDAGEDWRRRIDQQLKSTRLFICVIGPSWLSAFKARDPKQDVALYEIRKALKARRRIKLLPVLVGGAAFPAKSNLPRTLRRLADYHAFSFTSADRVADVDGLLSKAAEYLPKLNEFAAQKAIKQCLDDALTGLIGQVESAHQRTNSAIEGKYGSINEGALMAELWDIGRAAGDQAVKGIDQLPFRMRALKSGEIAKINEVLHVPKKRFGSRTNMEEAVEGLVQKTINEEKTIMRYVGGMGFGGGTGMAAGTIVPVLGNVVGGILGSVGGVAMANSEADADIRAKLRSEIGGCYQQVLDAAESLRSDPKWAALADDLARGRIH